MAHPTTVDHLLPGDHVCWTFDDHERHLSALVRFLRGGLERGEQVLYLTDTFLPDAFLAAAQAYGVDVREPERTGQLQVTTAEKSYLAGGAFEAERALDGWRAAIARARGQGYSALRVAADMGWTVRATPGVERLARYEAQANRIFAGGYVMALCCYDRRLFTSAELDRISAAHPATARAGAGAHEEWAPMLRVRRDPEGLKLAGAADRSNSEALASVLHDLVADARLLPDGAAPLVVDLAELTFADTAIARLLASAAAAVPGRLVPRGARPALAELLAVIDPAQARAAFATRSPA
ncbi:MEDS domain-containing protein [Nonomuraea sp. SMC257]|uniref:MEDS domain-containing protein n=1 Tax=Nonomuraea montanisoli TaxID=2741721 RepID=A0A7Y6I3Q0_9ACTN|nr:MEDS domain-containing protein [Nonomuraea montanisoli]NUW30971.1 MEDS domain-containing protein [Nonomuraea montanisoli]